MEHINRIEILGHIGTVKVMDTASNKMARLSVATDYIYKTKDGSAIIETTWHNVVIWEGRGCNDVSQLSKGDIVHVTGRLRTQSYVGMDGEKRYFTEIMANGVERLQE